MPSAVTMACATRAPTTTAGMLVFARGIVGISAQSATHSGRCRARVRGLAHRQRVVVGAHARRPDRVVVVAVRAADPVGSASPSSPARAPISSPISAASGPLRARARAPADAVRDHREVRALRVAQVAVVDQRRLLGIGAGQRQPPTRARRHARHRDQHAAGEEAVGETAATGARCRSKPRWQRVERSFAIVCSSGTNPWRAASASAAAQLG